MSRKGGPRARLCGGHKRRLARGAALAGADTPLAPQLAEQPDLPLVRRHDADLRAVHVAACKEALQHAHQPRRLRPVEARLTLGMLRRAALRSARLEKGERRGAARPRETAHRGPRGGVDACSRLQV